MTPAIPSSDLQDAAANARLVPPPGAVPQRLGDVRVPVPLVELFTIAAEYERAGKLQEADRLFNHILAVAPNQADSLHLSGLVAFRLGRMDEAVAKVEKAIQHGIDVALYLRNLCEIYRTLNRLDDAVATGRRAKQLAPNEPL